MEQLVGFLCLFVMLDHFHAPAHLAKDCDKYLNLTYNFNCVIIGIMVGYVVYYAISRIWSSE